MPLKKCLNAKIRAYSVCRPVGGLEEPARRWWEGRNRLKMKTSEQRGRMEGRWRTWLLSVRWIGGAWNRSSRWTGGSGARRRNAAFVVAAASLPAVLLSVCVSHMFCLSAGPFGRRCAVVFLSAPDLALSFSEAPPSDPHLVFPLGLIFTSTLSPAFLPVVLTSVGCILQPPEWGCYPDVDQQSFFSAYTAQMWWHVPSCGEEV